MQIRSLRALGFGLERIIELHLAGLREQIAEQRRLIDRLDGLATALRTRGDRSMDDLLLTIEEMSTVERYYTTEQLAELAERGRQLGEAGMRRAERDWQTLIDEVRAEMAAGTDPNDPKARALAARWRELVSAFTGGTPAIARSLNAMWREDATIHGMNTAEMRALGEYIGKATIE